MADSTCILFIIFFIVDPLVSPLNFVSNFFYFFFSWRNSLLKDLWLLVVLFIEEWTH